jgi:hypothetical protein
MDTPDPGKLDKILEVLRAHGVRSAKIGGLEVEFFVPDIEIDKGFDEQLREADERRPVRLTDPGQVTFR